MFSPNCFFYWPGCVLFTHPLHLILVGKFDRLLRNQSGTCAYADCATTWACLQWRASKEKEGAVLRVVHGLGHVNRGTDVAYSPATRLERLARSAATPSRLNLRTPNSAPSASTPGKVTGVGLAGRGREMIDV